MGILQSKAKTSNSDTDPVEEILRTLQSLPQWYAHGTQPVQSISLEICVKTKQCPHKLYFKQTAFYLYILKNTKWAASCLLHMKQAVPGSFTDVMDVVKNKLYFGNFKLTSVHITIPMNCYYSDVLKMYP